MSAALIAQLLATFGPGAIALIDKLITKIETKGDVTAAEWADIRASAMQTAQDRMKAQLQAAGIPLDSPQAMTLLESTI